MHDFEVINDELAAYAEDLAVRPQIVVANKCDMPGTEENVERVRAAAEKAGYPFFAVSCVTGAGIDALMDATAEEVFELRSKAAEEARKAAEEKPIRDWEADRRRRDRRIDIKNLGGNVWRVSGVGVERMVIQTDWDNEEGISYLMHRFERIGLDERLQKAGVKDGDEVRILGYAFTYESPDHDDEYAELKDSDDEVVEEFIEGDE